MANRLLDSFREQREAHEKLAAERTRRQQECGCVVAVTKLKGLPMYTRVVCHLCGNLLERLPLQPEPGGAFALDPSEELWEWLPVELGGEEW